MHAAHQAIASSPHKQNACNHPADVVGKHRRSKTQGAGGIIPTIPCHDTKGVSGKHFDHHDADQRNHQKTQDFTCPVIDQINPPSDRALPRRHIFRCFPRFFCPPLGDQFVRDFQVAGYNLFSHAPFSLPVISPYERELSFLGKSLMLLPKIDNKQTDAWGPEGPRTLSSEHYFKVSAWALPKLAFDACAPAQNGTAMSAKSFCDCHTSAKNSLSSDAA